MAKITTKITSFADVQKSLQEIEKVLNELTSSVNSSAETEVSDKDGKTGDIKTQRNADGTYSFEVKTDEGWKVPALGNSLIKFKDKLNTIRQTTPKSIEELAESDASTGDSTANLTTFDEKNNKFVLPRPDYDSGWQAIDNSTHLRTTSGLILTHNIGAMPKLVQLFCSEDNAEDEYHGTLHGLVENHSHGITYLVNSSTITIWTGDTAIFRLVHGSGTNTDVTSGYIRAMIWK